MKTIEQAAEEYANTKAKVVVSGTEITNTIDDLDLFSQTDFEAGVKFAQEWISMTELDHIIEPILIKDDDGNVGMGLTYVEDGYVFVNILRIYNPRNVNEKVDKDLCTIVGWRPIERK